MELRSEGLDFYINRLKEGKPFAFVRYGNGEWDCILGKATITRSLSQDLNAPRLRENLVNSIVNPYSPDDYMLAMQSPGTLERLGLLELIDCWLEANTRDLTWYAADVFHNASRDGLLAPLVKQLQNKRLIIVGPAYLEHLAIFDHARFVEIPDKNCWSTISRIKASLSSIILKDTVVSISAGPAAKPMIRWLYPRFRDIAFLIDFGSLWDVFAARPSRKYQRQMSVATLRRNIP